MDLPSLKFSWRGPFSPEEAPRQLENIQATDGIYVVFGRHRGFGAWPIWREQAWQRRIFGLGARTLHIPRYSTLPLQYIGSSKNLPKRIRREFHKILHRLSPQDAVVFVAVPVTTGVPTERNGKGHLKFIDELESCLIFSLRPRQCKESMAQPGSVPGKYFFSTEFDKVTNRQVKKASKRLPLLLKNDPARRQLHLHFDSASVWDRRVISSRAQEAKLSLSRWTEDKVPAVFRLMYGTHKHDLYA